MAHPITRLTAGSTFRRPDEPRGGIPELTTQEIAAAAGSIPDSLSYYAVMAHYCDQHPSADVWPDLMMELQSAVVRSWNILKAKRKAPKSMKLDTIHQIAAAAWYEFVGTKPQNMAEQADRAGMPLGTFRIYSGLHNQTVVEIQDRMTMGLRYVRKQLRDA